MDNIWIQLIVTVGSILGAIFTAYKFSISQAVKREKIFLDYIKVMQDKQLEYYTEKNGHLERVSVMFAKTLDKNSRALEKLSIRLKDKLDK